MNRMDPAEADPASWVGAHDEMPTGQAFLDAYYAPELISGPCRQREVDEVAVRPGWLSALRPDCGIPDHEWVRCRNCAHTGPCPCSGGPCCRREVDELAVAGGALLVPPSRPSRTKGREMINDPDEPGYRYPSPGERLWHAPWKRWAVVREPDETEIPKLPDDEVPVTFEDDGRRGIVKLRSLEPGDDGAARAAVPDPTEEDPRG